MLKNKMKYLAFSLFVFCFLAFDCYAQKSVMDFFDLRKAQLQAYNKQKLSFKIKIKDIKNGYIAYETENAETYEEMAYYIPASGNKFAVIVNFDCGPVCFSGMPSFFEIINGKLTDKTEKYFPKVIADEIEKGLRNARSKIKVKDRENTLVEWVEVPQIGTNIKFGLNEETLDGKRTFHVIFTYLHDKASGSFKLQKEVGF